ncbi:hypothetical protein CKAH01_07404 [Colletotrichum kahawae]|uniref:Uncharacterized protein n=1 Tax=Colletotrichum kahawae TaxID=34407 RepID=A0AAE0D1T5_COLKA|nr:hypothetical protein CKAH01_07404 [Colletotrichum kahawae]
MFSLKGQPVARTLPCFPLPTPPNDSSHRAGYTAAKIMSAYNRRCTRCTVLERDGVARPQPRTTGGSRSTLITTGPARRARARIADTRRPFLVEVMCTAEEEA